MAQVEHINPPDLPSPGTRYTHVVKVGPWAYIAGQTAGAMDGSVEGVGDMSAQAKRIYERLGKAVAAVGGKPSDIVQTFTYITDREHSTAIQPLRQAFFGDEPPTSTLVIVAGLARPEVMMEVEAIAYVGGQTSSSSPLAASKESSMPAVEHIQPAHLSNPGKRYTHVVRVGDWVYIAGQTASDENGNIVGVGDPTAQTEQVYNNLGKCMESVGGKLTDIVKTTVYVVGREHLDAIRAAREGRFGDKPPTSTLLVISGLARPEFLLEIEAVAYVGK
jgi:enamine deaminase RidA (YjgF/YER057c/UK114 family)